MPLTRFVVFFDDMATSEWKQCNSIEDALEQIMENLGTFEPNCVLSFDATAAKWGLWRDVSEEVARLWAGRIADGTDDLESEAYTLPRFVERFFPAEAFLEDFKGHQMSEGA